jgi:hypothetical protein
MQKCKSKLMPLQLLRLVCLGQPQHPSNFNLTGGFRMNWTIAQLERNSADDGVTVAHWRCSKTVGDHTASSYGTCGFTPDVEKAGFVAFDALTEEAVIGWVQESMT